MGTVIMMVSAGVLLLFRNQLGAFFSTDREVVMLTSMAVPTLAISLIGGGERGGGQASVCV